MGTGEECKAHVSTRSSENYQPELRPTSQPQGLSPAIEGTRSLGKGCPVFKLLTSGDLYTGPAYTTFITVLSTWRPSSRKAPGPGKGLHWNGTS